MGLGKEEGANVVTSNVAPNMHQSSFAAFDYWNVTTNTVVVQFNLGLWLSEPFVIFGPKGGLLMLHGSAVAEAVASDFEWFAKNPTRRFRRRWAVSFEFNRKQLEPVFTVVVRCRPDLHIRLATTQNPLFSLFRDHQPDDRELEDTFVCNASTPALRTYFGQEQLA